MADEAPKKSGSESQTPTEVIVTLIIIAGFFAMVGGILDRLSLIPGGKAFSVYDTISTISEISVFDTPAGNIIGTQARNAVGVVTDGVSTAKGIRYWFVDFAAEPDGWVDENGIGKTLDGASVGNEVVAKEGISIWSEPGSGLLGNASFGARGVLVRGPMVVDGESWWFVDFEEDTPDGWVRASDIILDEQETLRHVIDRTVGDELRAFWNFFIAVSTLVSLTLLTGIVYCVIRMNQLTREMNRKYATYPKEELEEKEEAKRWRRVRELAASDAPNDWRQAIIEADIMLGEVLEKAGYLGDSVGERLKRVEQGFVKLNEAWAAHKVRNEIAHSGSDFILTRRDARSTIELYEQVLKEFYFL